MLFWIVSFGIGLPIVIILATVIKLMELLKNLA